MSFRAFKFYLFHPIIFLRRLGYAFYEWRHPDEPWIAQGAVRFLDENLTKDMCLFEWGSGRSTQWFSERVKEVVSIEYHEGWAKKLEETVGKKDNVDLRYIPLEHEYKAPTQRVYEKTPQYVAEIKKFEKEHFDVIIIDGHYRLTCVDHSLDRLKSGGYLVIDNSNREKLEDWNVPSDWALLHQSENVMTETSIWQKN